MKTALIVFSLIVWSVIVRAQTWRLDSTFADHGIDTIPLSGPDMYVELNFVTPHPDSTWIIGGTVYKIYFDPWGAKILTISLRSDGALDSSFKDEGLDTLGYGGDRYDVSLSTQVQNDGKILHAGYSFQNPDSIAFITRLKKNGSIDSSFGDYGDALFSIGYGDAIFQEMVCLPDGRIVCTGQFLSFISSEEDPFIMRLHDDGTLDTSFAEGGFVITHIVSPYEGVYGFSLTDESKFIVLVSNFGVPNEASYLIRYDSTGRPDSSFDDDGILSLHVPDSSYAYKQMVIDHLSRIVLASLYYDGAKYSVDVTRYLQDGIIDSSFGNNGTVLLNADSAVIGHSPLLVEADDDILIAANHFKIVNQTYEYDPILFRVTNEGKIDSSFGTNGVMYLPMPNEQHVEVMCFTDDDHFILVGTNGKDYIGKSLLVMRFTDFPVGMHEIKPDSPKLRLFPNPVSDVLHVYTIAWKSSIGKISCFSIEGQRVFEMTTKLTEGKNHLTIPVEGLIPGMYIIQFGDNHEFFRAKFIVTRTN